MKRRRRKGARAFCHGDPYAVKVYDPYAGPAVECAGSLTVAREIREFYRKEGVETKLVRLGKSKLRSQVRRHRRRCGKECERVGRIIRRGARRLRKRRK